MINVLIADDHAVVREGLKQIISDTEGMRIKDSAENGQEVIEKISLNIFDILVLDITMPGQSGLDILKQVKLIKPDLPVLVLSIHPEEQYAIRVLKAGASGYLNKDSAPEKLIESIIKVANGGHYVSEVLNEKLFHLLSGDTSKLPHYKLSDREFQVLIEIGKGKSTSKIANEMILSEKTISTYKSRIMNKLGLENTAQIVRYALENKLE